MKIGLTTKLDLDREKVLDALRRDKKRKGGDIDFVLLNRIGSADVQNIPINELEAVVSEIG